MKPIINKSGRATPRRGGSIHPQGWVPVETGWDDDLKNEPLERSIHPQGWVPVETPPAPEEAVWSGRCSIHPQGWVPVETVASVREQLALYGVVAFTPKGGCPLKRDHEYRTMSDTG